MDSSDPDPAEGVLPPAESVLTTEESATIAAGDLGAASESDAAFPLIRAALLRLRSSDGHLARLARGTLWMTLGMLAGQLFAMAGGIIAARILGPSQFGAFGILRSTVGLFAVVAGSGLSLSAMKLVGELRTIDPGRTGRSVRMLLQAALVMSGIAMTVCLVGAGFISRTLLHAPDLATGLRIVSLLLLLNALGGVQVGTLNGLEAFNIAARITTAEGALTLCTVSAGAYFGGLNGAITGMVAGPAILFPFKHAALMSESRKRGISLGVGAGRVELRSIWTDVLPSILIGVSSQPFEWTGRVLLARQQDGFVQVGLFTAAFAWGQVVSLASSQLTGTAVPIMANVFAGNERHAFVRIFRVVAVSTIAISLAVIAPLILLSGWIMRAYGRGFTGGGPVLVIIAAAYGLAAISTLFRSTLVATGNIWRQSMHAVIWGFALIAGFYLFRSKAAIGLALAYACAYGVVVITQGTSVWRAVASRAVRSPTS